MPLTRRLAAAAVAAATVAGSLLAAPPAHAEGWYDCFSASRSPAQGGYDLSAHGCAGAGYVDVVIKVLAGPEAGLHRCGWIFTWHGDLAGHGCHEE